MLFQCCGIDTKAFNRAYFFSFIIQLAFFGNHRLTFQLTNVGFLMRIIANLLLILMTGIKIYSDWFLIKALQLLNDSALKLHPFHFSKTSTIAPTLRFSVFFSRAVFCLFIVLFIINFLINRYLSIKFLFFKSIFEFEFCSLSLQN